ncbi:hypothetical protein METP1_00867 [Methanosarcinales archaeon]|nr:hypothetical protein METP1_00867 [Methanosarcinales archaeon]
MNERISLADKKTEVKSRNPVSQIRRKTEISQSMNSPVDHILFLQRTMGNQAVGKLIKSGALQAKLRIGQPGDVYEQEADRVAEQVMRMPDVSSSKDIRIQRKCPKCLGGLLGKDKKDEKLQAKEIASQTPEVTPQTEANINALKGGQPLPESTRAFFEPRFGYDLSRVRVHADSQAAESARTVNARAYTLGQDIMFGAGEFSPGTSEGQRLMAHELTHVVQQGDAGSRTIAKSPAEYDLTAWLRKSGHRSIRATSEHRGHSNTDTAAVTDRQSGSDSRDAGFVAASDAPQHSMQAASIVSYSSGQPIIQRQTVSDPGVAADIECDTSKSNPILWFSFDSTDLRSDPAVDSTVHLASLIGRVQRHFANAAGLGRLELRGYASNEGDSAHNLDLSRRRAERVRSLLESAGIPGRQMTAVGLGASTTMPGREWNRRVEICLTPPIEYIEMEPETVTADIDCVHPPRAVARLEDYSFLVGCIERAMPTVSSRDILSMLRQAYYGTGHWGEVIPCGTTGGSTALSSLRSSHRALYNTLIASKVVRDVDLGHVFTGLEAMVCPTPEVEIEVFGPNPIVAMPNEEFATWGGDLGSAAASRTHDEADRGLRRPWSHYFGTTGSMASYEDLRGDIDAFAIRAGLASRCAGTRMTALSVPTTPISQLLFSYYGAGPGVTAADRYHCMVEALGGTIVGGRITNKSTLIAAMRPRVRSFAETFYLSLVTVPLFAIGPVETMMLFSYSGGVSQLFVDWLESQL